MANFRYVIVGGGMAGAAAAKGIREADPTGPIAIIGREPDPPYRRPHLSKALWKGRPEEQVWIKLPPGVEVVLGREVTRLDTQRKVVIDDQGAETGYEALLLATGGRTRRLPFGGDGVLYYRTFQDYKRLRGQTAQGSRFAVIGGGFIGSEIAAALAMNGSQVSMVFPDPGIGSNVYPAGLSAFVTSYYREKGVDVLAGRSVAGLEQRNGAWALKLRDEAAGRDEELVVDHVVAGVGIAPETALAEAAGIALDNGIAVDRFLRTSAPGVFAAGDAASFLNPALGRRIRVEHEDNANTMGRIAGLNMAGRETPYDHLPFFYSDLFDLGYEAVGNLSSRLETVEQWEEPNRKGVIYYLDGGRVAGVLLWDVWGKVAAARELVSSAGPFSRAEIERSRPISPD
jgi:3-phenylpropionate/trans-cinnamate dioxygenase ferredoxin reductase subunit